MKDGAADEATRRPRHKDKAQKAKASKERKLSRVKKSKLVTLTEGSIENQTERQQLAIAEGYDREDNDGSDVERGLTQDKILQLRALDMDDDGDWFGSGFNLMSSVFGHSHHDDRRDTSDTTWYVENEVSGEFFRVRRRGNSKNSTNNVLSQSKRSLRRLRRHRHHHTHRDDDSASDENDGHAMHPAWCKGRVLHDMEAALGILGYGIVVGLSWMDAFNLGAAHDRFFKNETTRQRFICTYSGMANRSHQVFFLLFNLSLLGLMRKISRLRAQRQVAHEDPRLRRFRVHSLRLLQGAFMSMATALLVLVLISPSALRLTTAFARDPSWCDYVVEKATITTASALSRLQQCAVVNAVLLSIGWLLVCIQCNLGMSSHLSLRRHLIEAYAAIDQLELRADHVQGKTLDSVTIDALKELIQQHHRAVEATESVLVTKLRMQNPMEV